MNRVLIMMKAKPGMYREALAAVKAGGDYVRSKYDIKSELCVQLFGVAGVIYVIGEPTDAAQAMANQAKLMADDNYMELVRKLSEVIIDPPTIALLQSI